MSEVPEYAVDTEPLTVMTCPHCNAETDVSNIPSFSKTACASCGREMTVGARFGAFLLLELLGSGGMGSVFKALDETLGRLVAIKVMLRSLGDDPVFSETFKREAQAAAKLNHPHIAQIYSFGQQAGQPYIVMELVPGKNLEEMIGEGRPLSPEFVMSLGADIADGLRMAAAVNLVHGDIKPENILMDEQGQGKLVDFGIATVSEKNEDEIWGTPYYISPEKVRRQKIDLRTDIYSLGATLYHALAGRPPFEGENAIEVIKSRFNGPPTPLTEIRSNLDPQVDQIIERMLQIEPSRRYPTYESLLSDMQRYLEKVGAAKTTTSMSSQFAGSRRVVVKKKPKSIRVGGSAPTSTKTLKAKTDPGEESAGGDAGKAPALPTASGADGALPPPRGKKRKRRWPWVLGFIGLLLAGGAAVMVLQRPDAAEPSEDAARERAQRYEALRGEWKEIHEQAAALVDGARQAALESSNMLAQVSNVFTSAFGEDVDWDEPRETRIEEISRVHMVQAMQSITSSIARIPEQALAVIEAGKGITETGAHFEESARKAVTVIPESWVNAARQALEKASAQLDEITAANQPLQSTLKSVNQDFDKLDAERMALAEARETAEEQARREAERKRQEAEKARREAQRKAKIEAEIEKIREVEAAQREKIQQQRFLEVSWPLRDLKAEIETKEGLRELENARERLDRIIALYAFLKEQLAEHGFKRGWVQNNNIVQDIVGSTERVIQLPGREVPWHEVEIAAIVRMIHHFLVRGEVAENQSLRVRANQLVNAALYAKMFGRGNPSAEALAEKLLDQAQRMLPLIEDDIRRLLPDHAREADSF